MADNVFLPQLRIDINIRSNCGHMCPNQLLYVFIKNKLPVYSLISDFKPRKIEDLIKMPK